MTEEVSELRNEPPYYVAQMLRQGAGIEDFIDLPDEDLYRVTVIRERTSDESNLPVDTDDAR